MTSLHSSVGIYSKYSTLKQDKTTEYQQSVFPSYTRRQKNKLRQLPLMHIYIHIFVSPHLGINAQL